MQENLLKKKKVDAGREDERMNTLILFIVFQEVATINLLQGQSKTGLKSLLKMF